VQPLALGRTFDPARHGIDGVLDRLPHVVTQVARDTRLGRAAPAARQRERVAGQVAGVDQPGEQAIELLRVDVRLGISRMKF